MKRFTIHSHVSAMLAFLIGLGIAFLSPLHAQQFYGSVVGTVTDSTGAVVPGATVTLQDVATNEKRTAKSDAAGNYEFVDLVPATYRVEVDAANFKRFLRNSVVVEVNKTSRADAKLEVGAANQTVEVSTSSIQLQTDSGTLSTEIGGAQVQEMPLLGRNVMNLLALAPGVMPQNALEAQTGLACGPSCSSAAASSGSTNPLSWGGGANVFLINGGDNVEYLDGAPINVLQGGNVALVPTQDSLQEFSIETSASNSDTGRVTGGAINFTSKSGTNSWHGSVYEYFRNTDLDANTYYDNLNAAARPEFNQNQYGLNIGLPIKKDRVFFFGSWEILDILTQDPISTNVPTANMQAGIFSRQITDPLAPGDGCVITPAGSGASETWTLGSGCLDPTAQVMRTYYPLPNSTNPSNNYFVNASDGDHEDQENVRMDFNISPKQRLFLHQVWWNIHDPPLIPFLKPLVQWNIGQTSGGFNSNLYIVGDTYTVSPKTVIDVRAINLRFFYAKIPRPNTALLSQFGPNWAALEALEPPGSHGFPGLALTGSGAVHNLFSVTGGGPESWQLWDNYGINGSVTHVAGRHSLKMGAEARLMDLESSTAFGGGGSSTFGVYFTQGNGACPVSVGCGDEFAEFLMGYFKTASFGGSYGATNYSYYQGYYVQDTWQAAHKLTLNLGLRWELPGGEAVKSNRTTVLEPYSTDPYTLAYGTRALVATPAYPGRSAYSIHHNAFDPRVGFAYRLDNKTVVRGGFGVTTSPIDEDAGGGGPAGDSVNSATTSSSNTTGTPVIAPTHFLQNPFPQGLLQAPFRSNPAFMQYLMDNVETSGGLALSGYYPYIPLPYVQEWNFTVQRQFTSNFQTSVSYVGTHAVHQRAGGNFDEIPASAYTVTTTGTAAPGATGSQVPNQTAAAATGPYAGTNLTSLVPGTCSIKVSGVPTTFSGCYSTPNGTVTNANWLVGQTLQPYPNYSGASYSSLTYGNNHYNALQVQSQLRLKGAGEVGGAYTWAKTIGDNANISNSNTTAGYQDIYNHQADRTVSGTPMRFVVNYVLPLPFGQGQPYAHFSGVADKIVSGWQFNGITSFQHGGYLSIGNNSQNTFNKDFGSGTTRASYVPAGYTVIGGTTYNCNSRKKVSGSAVSRLNEWFNVGCFEYPGNYTYGNENVNDPVLFGQGQDNWDIAMLKSTKATERATVDFRAEAINAFNRVQFSNPTTTVGNANYGKVTSQANNPRLLQLSLRVSF